MTLRSVSTISLAGICLALTMALFAIMFVTNPGSIGPLGVTLWFMGFWLIIGADLTFSIYNLKALRQKDANKTVNSKSRLIESSRLGLMAAAALTIILGLSSLGQLDARDIILIICLLVLAEFYIRKRS